MRHWRGELPLWLTTLGSLVGLRLLLYALQSAMLTPHSLLSTLFWVTLGLAVLLWQLRGALKAVDHNMSYSGDMATVYLCYLSMALVLAISLLQVVDAFAALQRPPAKTSAPPAKILLLPVSDNGRTVHLQGSLDYPIRQQLLDTLERFPDINTVVLNSGGGHVFAARAMALTLQEKKLHTRVEGVCYSACTLVFMAGEKRQLGKSATLGFHRYALADYRPGEQLSIDEQLRRDQRYFLARGVSPDFVDDMFSQMHSEIWEPSREELRVSGVLHSGN